MKKKQIFLILLSLLLFQGCGSIAYDGGSSFVDEKLLSLLVTQVKKLHPMSFRTVHRVILKVSDREFVFEGYLLVKKPDRIRLLAKGSMGGTAFDAVHGAQGEVSILKNPANLQPSWIKEGALRDASVLYLTSWWDQGFLVQHRSGDIGLAWDGPGGIREEFVFHGTHRELTNYFRARDGKCLYQIEFSKPTSSEDSSGSLQTIKITDFSIGYHLTIQVIQLEESELDDELFEKKP